MSDVVVDALGLLCPLPVLRLRQALAALAPGARAVLLSDDEEITRDLPAWCDGSGHELVSLEAEHGAAGRRWRGVVQKR